MAWTAAEEARIQAIEKMLVSIQQALNQLATKRQVNSIVATIQPQIDDLNSDVTQINETDTSTMLEAHKSPLADDHTNYHTDIRGDVRYYTKPQTDLEISTAVDDLETTINGDLATISGDLSAFAIDTDERLDLVEGDIIDIAAGFNTFVSTKGEPSGLAELGADGKVPNAQLPALAITETFVVSGQDAMLALSEAEVGDVAIRTELSRSFILQGADPSVLGNWQELLTPPNAVTSVFGRVGNVASENSDYPNYVMTNGSRAITGDQTINGTVSGVAFVSSQYAGTGISFSATDLWIKQGGANFIRCYAGLKTVLYKPLDVYNSYIFDLLGPLRLGGNATSTHSLASGDTLVTGKLEVDGMTYLDAASGLQFGGNQAISSPVSGYINFTDATGTNGFRIDNRQLDWKGIIFSNLAGSDLNLWSTYLNTYALQVTGAISNGMGSASFYFGGNTFKSGKDLQFVWTDTAYYTGAVDTGLKRSAASTLQVTNGSTGLGNLSVNEFTAAGTTTVSGVLIAANQITAKSFINFGNYVGAGIYWSTYDEPDAFKFMTGAASRSFIFCGPLGDTYFKNYDHPQQANPTLFVQSIADPDIDNTHWVSLSHDQTNGTIATGKGALNLIPASTQVLFPNGAGSVPSITFANDADTGINCWASNQLSFFAGGAELGRVNGYGFYTVNTGQYYWATRARLSSPADGILKITNNAENSGVQLDSIATADTLTLKKIADGTPAHLDCLKISISTIYDKNNTFYTTGGTWQLGSGTTFSWGSGATYNTTKDLGLARSAASTLQVNDGSTGAGKIQLGLSTILSAPEDGTLRLGTADGSKTIMLRAGVYQDSLVLYNKAGTGYAGLYCAGISSMSNGTIEGGWIRVDQAIQFWGSGSDDVGIKRVSTGLIKITNASTGYGSLQIGSDCILTQTAWEGGLLFSNVAGTKRVGFYIPNDSTMTLLTAAGAANATLSAANILASNSVSVSGSGVGAWSISYYNAGHLTGGSSTAISFTDGNVNGTRDVGITRASAGNLKITDGTTGTGGLTCNGVNAGSGSISTYGTLQLNGGSIIHRQPGPGSSPTLTYMGYPTIRQCQVGHSWSNAMIVALGAVTSGTIELATLAAKMRLKDALVVIDTAAGGVTTLTVSVGRTGPNYTDYITACDAKAGPSVYYGCQPAERGTNLTGYDLPSWTATTKIYVRFECTGGTLDQVTGCTGHIDLTTELML